MSRIPESIPIDSSRRLQLDSTWPPGQPLAPGGVPPQSETPDGLSQDHFDVRRDLYPNDGCPPYGPGFDVSDSTDSHSNPCHGQRVDKNQCAHPPSSSSNHPTNKSVSRHNWRAPPPLKDLPGNNQWIVEKILDHRTKNGTMQMLVQWLGFPRQSPRGNRART